MISRSSKRKHPLLNTWRGMIYRCLDEDHPQYQWYGARGITVCKRWLDVGHDGFANFVSDMGERPDGTTLDRINNDGPYKPSNCRWATLSEQMRNRRWKPKRNLSDNDVRQIRKLLKAGGKYGFKSAIARRYDIHPSAIWFIENNKRYV